MSLNSLKVKDIQLQHGSKSFQEGIPKLELGYEWKANGWQGDAISAIEIDGQKYILDGHHRVAAAQQAGVQVQYNLIDSKDLSNFGYDSIDDVIITYSEAGSNRLR